jgi:hypothetical protein
MLYFLTPPHGSPLFLATVMSLYLFLIYVLTLYMKQVFRTGLGCTVMAKTPLTEDPNCVFSLAFFRFITGLLKKLQHACAVISETVKRLWTGNHVRLPCARYASHSTACIIQDSAAMQASRKFRALLKYDHNRWRRLMCTKFII